MFWARCVCLYSVRLKTWVYPLLAMALRFPENKGRSGGHLRDQVLGRSMYSSVTSMLMATVGLGSMAKVY